MLKKLLKRRNKKGFTLIELIVVLGDHGDSGGCCCSRHDGVREQGEKSVVSGELPCGLCGRPG